MPYIHAARARLIALTLGLGAAGLSLAGCGSVDDALFGDRAASPMTAPAPETAAQMSAPETAAQTPAPEAAPAPAEAQQAAPETPAPAAVMQTADLGITLPGIAAANSTGTGVGQTVEKLRGELSALHDKAAADLQQLAALKAAATQDTTTYQNSKSRIIIRLQAGTTRANPELVKEWNGGQSALDSLAGNINSLAQLASGISSDLDRAGSERRAIADAFNMSGGVDEDHRQLTALQGEADDLAEALAQMQKGVTHSVQRETAFAGNERDSLATLESAIRNGELYPTTDIPATATASLSPSAATAAPSNAILTIRFDQKKVDFQQDLYAALNKALQAKPAASFRVVAVSPTQGSAAAVQSVQGEAHKHAQDVLKAMTGMGVPAARVTISSSTDPSVSASEVRVYAH